MQRIELMLGVEAWMDKVRGRDRRDHCFFSADRGNLRSPRGRSLARKDEYFDLSPQPTESVGTSPCQGMAMRAKYPFPRPIEAIEARLMVDIQVRRQPVGCE